MSAQMRVRPYLIPVWRINRSTEGRSAGEVTVPFVLDEGEIGIVGLSAAAFECHWYSLRPEADPSSGCREQRTGETHRASPECVS